MTLGTINYLAVFAAAIASFVFGGMYYNVLSRQWMDARGVAPADMERAKAQMGSIPTPYAIAFVAEAIMAWMLAGMLLHLAQGGMPITLRNGVISGLFLWAGFVATTLAVNHAFQGAKWRLCIIDGGHWLGVLLVQGAVLGWWGVR
jgi:hypothetical protein